VYEGGSTGYTGVISTPFCYNGTGEELPNVTALYRMGPADSSTSAIVFYGGKLKFTVVEKMAEAFLDYAHDPGKIDYRACTFGTSEWTLFSENNFEGNSTCLKHSFEMDCTTSRYIDQSVGSVIRGCNLSKATVAETKLLFTP